MERIEMYVKGVENVYEMNLNGIEGEEKVKYGDVLMKEEKEY